MVDLLVSDAVQIGATRLLAYLAIPVQSLGGGLFPAWQRE